MAEAPLIRAAVAADAAALHRLHMEAIGAIGEWHYSAAQRRAWSGERTPQHYLAPIATRLMRVAQAPPTHTHTHTGTDTDTDSEATALLGFAQLDLATGAVEAIYVRPAAQRLGIGKRLLQALESSASGAGAQVLWLDASLNAVPFYERHGFEALSAHEHPVGAQVTIPCVRMRKRL